MLRYCTLLLSSMFLAVLSQAQIASTFDADADGWTLSDNNTLDPQTVNYFSTGGNPGGYVSATKTSSSQPYFWTSPAKFGGNVAYFSYGQDFSFDLQINHVPTVHGSAGDVQIRTPSGSILALNLPAFPAQAPAWSSHVVRLDETAGWRVGSIGGPLATKAQMLQYLSGVASFRVNIKYNSGVTTFTGAIDNAVLNQRTITPAPSIGSLSATSGNAGASITINGNNFDSTPANNAVYFGGMEGMVTSASSTALTVTVPTGSAFGPIRVINKTTGKSTLSSQKFNPTFTGGGRIIPASFKTRFSFDHAGGMGGLALADMDSDGWLDIAVANEDNTGIRIYRNLGSGGTLSAASFASPVFFPTSLSGTNGAGLVVRDFDNDGKLDMVTSGWTGGPGAFATFRNTSTPGNLTFDPVEIWLAASDESPPTAAEDIDGDGLVDLVSGEGSSPGSTWIIQNLSTPGNIEFGYRQVFFNVGSNSHQGATLADLDGDGKPEFIHKLSNVLNQQNIHVNTSTPGVISFGPPLTLPVGIQGGMIVYDFNKDGKNDLAWKAGFSNDDIYIRLNANTGGPLSIADFSTQIILDSETGYYGGAALADINGDGEPDFVITDSDEAAVFENNYSAGTFDASDFIKGHLFSGVGATTYPTTIHAGDLNGDGKPEMVFGTTNTTPDKIVVYENQNTAAPAISVSTVSPLQAPVGAMVTITGNNFSAIPIDNYVYFGGVRATVLTASPTLLTVEVPAGAGHDAVSVRVGELTSVYHLPFHPTFSAGVNFDNTNFAPPVEFALANADYDIEVADLDNDGKPDVAAQVSVTNRTTFFTNTHVSGAITTGSLALAGTTAGTATNPKLFDIDGNGFIDIVGAGGTMHQNTSSPGLITFGPQLTLGIGAGNLAPADFNRDGKLDLAATNGGSAQLLLMENRSSAGSLVAAGTYGSLSNDFTIAKPATGGGIVSVDLDADGYADVVATNPGSDNLSIFPSASATRVNTSTFGTRIDIATGDNPGRVYTGDFDSDNKLDILIYHSAGANSTQLSIYHNQSTPGNFSFNRVDLTNPSATTVATVADMDGDGKPEIITVSETGNRFSIFKNIHTSGALTAASFAAPFNTTVTAPRGLTTGDLNLDGKPEIILTRAAGFLVVYENLISPASTQNFVTQWNLATTGSGATQLSFGTATSGVVNYTWQEISPGSASGSGSWSGATLSLTGLPAGATIRLQITPTNFQRIILNNGADRNRLTQVEQWGTTAWTSMNSAFYGCTNLQVTATDVPDLSAVTDLSQMFRACINLNSPANIGTWNTSAVTTMYRMFYSANAFNQNIGTWNTAAVTNMSQMFYGATSFNQNIGAWNTSAVTNMSEMFTNASSFNQNISAWNTSAVTNMYSMFYEASAFNQGIGAWNTASVTTMEYMFYNTSFNQDIGAWNTGAVTNMSEMFSSASSFNQDISTWNTAAVTTMFGMFSQATSFNQNIGTWNTGAVTDLRNMFSSATSFNQNLGMWTIHPSANLSGMLNNSGMDCTTYSATLMGWSANPLTPAGRTLGATGRQYGTNAVAARTNLTATKGWTITGDAPSGVVCGTVPLPTIISFTPVSGPVGITVVITGTNFTTTAAENFVQFNGIAATATSSTATSITTTVPNGATTGPISVTVMGNTATSALDFTVTSPPNQPPSIETSTSGVPIEGIVTIDLLPLLSDPDDNLNLSTLRVVNATSQQGAAASITGTILTLDYGDILFSGTDQVLIEVCDVLGECTQQLLQIEVAGDVTVYNAFSPNGDNVNEFFLIQYIQLFPDTQNNRVTIFNRWGDEVFSITNYNNTDRVFRGLSNSGKELPTGTYFYKIEFTSGRATKTGYVSLKR